MPVEKKRCDWVEDDPLYIEYHDKEWGRPLRGDNELFERMALEMFQAGLSWRLILRKRKALKKAFAEFSIDRVASFTKRDIERLLKDEAIIRNRLKIECTIENARRLKKIIKEHGSFANYIHELNGDLDDFTKEFKRSFRFMGPKIVGSFLLSIGKLEGAHEPGCYLAPNPKVGRSKTKSAKRK
jgi:DNA-3-methyladenine glycosylase I